MEQYISWKKSYIISVVIHILLAVVLGLALVSVVEHKQTENAFEIDMSISDDLKASAGGGGGGGGVGHEHAHDGGNYALCEFDAIDIYNYHKATKKGVNCRHLAITLNEMYLAMGIPSRYITCMPKNPEDSDCHVINSVYSSQLQKWIWIDPTNNAYVKDEKGNLLSIAEVRDRLIHNKPLVLNEDANWNNKEKQTKEEYLENYMAKNLYWFSCPLQSQFNPESRFRKTATTFVALLPIGFVKPKEKEEYITHDPDYFWQKP